MLSMLPMMMMRLNTGVELAVANTVAVASGAAVGVMVAVGVTVASGVDVSGTLRGPEMRWLGRINTPSVIAMSAATKTAAITGCGWAILGGLAAGEPNHWFNY